MTEATIKQFDSFDLYNQVIANYSNPNNNTRIDVLKERGEMEYLGSIAKNMSNALR